MVLPHMSRKIISADERPTITAGGFVTCNRVNPDEDFVNSVVHALLADVVREKYLMPQQVEEHQLRKS